MQTQNLAHNLIRNAHVEIITHRDAARKPMAQVIVNDEFSHIFDSKSRISESLGVMTESQLKDKMDGGAFFFIGEKLIDFRYGDYNGFIHSEDSINKLMDVLGFRVADTMSERRIMRLNTVTNNGGIILNKVWDDSQFDVDGYMDGGDFTSRVGFTWNPFSESVRGIFEIVRQICSNGMVGINDLINCKVPLHNLYNQHLDIAAIQLSNTVQAHTRKRLSEMGRERATVADLQLVKNHASERLDFMVNVMDEAARTRLMNIARIADPKRHLQAVYNEEVFNNSAIGSRAPSHLTKYDAWNLVTEMFTHTLETSTSTGSALQRLANALVFPAKDATKGLIATQKPLLSAFSDPETAFFGTLDTK